jgi:hypothetical protein
MTICLSRIYGSGKDFTVDDAIELFALCSKVIHERSASSLSIILANTGDPSKPPVVRQTSRAAADR